MKNKKLAFKIVQINIFKTYSIQNVKIVKNLVKIVYQTGINAKLV